jgi:thymidine kinase
VHVFGLDGDYQRKPMGHILKLCAMADSFRKINALCIYCQNGTPAPFSLLTTTTVLPPEDHRLIGGAEFYSAVCRKHFLAYRQNTLH